MTFSPWALTSAKVTKAKVVKGFPALGKVVTSSEVRIDTRTLQAQASALDAKLASAIATQKHDDNELQRERLFLQSLLCFLPLFM